MKAKSILGIHFGHNASVGLLEGGEIKCLISEERLTRIKNATGWPARSLEYIYKNFSPDIDYYVFSQKDPFGYSYLKKRGFAAGPYHSFEDYRKYNQTVPIKIQIACRFFPNLFYSRLLKQRQLGIVKIQEDKSLRREMEEELAKHLNVGRDKVLYLDHHESHALSTKFFVPDQSLRTLVFTLDGGGDGLCASVSIFDKGQRKRLLGVSNMHSLGLLYRDVTAYLGMKPDEHEFKVMGLAPYAKQDQASRLKPVFQQILWLNSDGSFESKIPMSDVRYYLRTNLAYWRFDTIASALQDFTEEIVIEWVKYWVSKTQIRDVALAGGVFMNVKLNQKIAESSFVHNTTVVPSAGDETTVLGACYFGYEKSLLHRSEKPMVKKLKHLYFGSEWSDVDIEKTIKEKNLIARYKVERPINMVKSVAELLAKNEIVARMSGRMEFGARALGNRSILANPSQFEQVRIINEMIKNRDFWMPFAASVLEEDVGRYFNNPKKIEAPFMAITLETTEEARKDLAAAIHPYDKTCRPQIVSAQTNPSYHAIISEFKNLTKIGGVLNTSFNLHGEPNVESPHDAIHTFEDSGLKHLALGSFLISKE